MRLSTATACTPASTAPDLELIAQRIVKLAEIATLEHLETLMASQARTLLTTAQAESATAAMAGEA